MFKAESEIWSHVKVDILIHVTGMSYDYIYLLHNYATLDSFTVYPTIQPYWVTGTGWDPDKLHWLSILSLVFLSYVYMPLILPLPLQLMFPPLPKVESGAQ